MKMKVIQVVFLIDTWNSSRTYSRSSRSQMFFKIGILKKLIYKRLQHRSFPVNIAKFLRTAFFIRTHLVAASVRRTLHVLTQLKALQPFTLSLNKELLQNDHENIGV